MAKEKPVTFVVEEPLSNETAQKMYQFLINATAMREAKQKPVGTIRIKAPAAPAEVPAS